MTKTNEYYSWVAEDNLGQTCREGNVEFKEILALNKEGKIKYFGLEPKRSHLKRVVVTLDDRKRLIFFRKRIIHKGKKQFQWTLHYLGWQDTIKGVNVKSLMYIYPSGAIEHSFDKPTLMKDYHNQLIKNIYESQDNTMSK